jgi:hypothetical protein
MASILHSSIVSKKVRSLHPAWRRTPDCWSHSAVNEQPCQAVYLGVECSHSLDLCQNFVISRTLARMSRNGLPAVGLCSFDVNFAQDCAYPPGACTVAIDPTSRTPNSPRSSELRQMCSLFKEKALESIDNPTELSETRRNVRSSIAPAVRMGECVTRTAGPC